MGDLGFAIRQARRRPLFTLTAVVVIATGLGSAVAVFSLLYRAVLEPLPYPDSGRLVYVHNSFPQGQVPLTGVSGFDYAEIARDKRTFESAGVYYFNDLTLTGAGPARHVDVVDASATLFQVLEIQPTLGRAIADADDRPGAPGVLLLSDAFWRGAFGADPAAVGRTVQLNRVPYTIVGVMPPAMPFPYPATQLWIPMALRPGEFTAEGGRSEKWLHMVARLAPGARAEPALATTAHRLARQFPTLYPRNRGWHFAARPMADEQTEGVRRWLYLAFGAVLAVLVIACWNVSGLLMIRTAARGGEIAVRAALGASRYRIVRQFLTEAALLVAAGCGAGLLLAAWASDLLNRYGPIGEGARIETWTLLFALVMAAGSTLAAGLLPALAGPRAPIEQALKTRAARTTASGGGWRFAIVAPQIAAAVTLVFTATVLSRSFIKLTQVPAGFQAKRIWTGAVELPGTRYADGGWNTQLFEPLQERLAALPGVEAASAVNAIPFGPSGTWTEQLRLPGRASDLPRPEARIALALPGYFEAMKIPLLGGRTFTSRDRAGAPLVAVIDAELARRYFPGEDALGKLIAAGGQETPARIVGIVGNVHSADLGGPQNPQVYFPELEERADLMYFVVRTRADIDLTPAVRDAVAHLDPGVALFDVARMDQRVAGSLGLRQFIAWLLDGFAGLGLLLAAVGLYASLAHLVEVRRREIGIRTALGARRDEIVRMMLARGAVPVGTGLVTGAAGAFLSERLIRAYLFGARVSDAATWAVVLTVLTISVAAAIWLPARRAAAVDPLAALREE